MIGFLIIVFLFGLVGVYMLAQLTQTPLEDARAYLSGRLAPIQRGLTHYQWHGPEDGPVMVCIHGLSTPSYVFSDLVPKLVDQGYRVLTYDLYGRGFSDRVPGAQTREYFLRQLRDLLDQLGIDKPVTLCGYSMGGAIATARAVEAPDSVTRLILIAPAGLRHEMDEFTRFVTRWPVLGDWLNAVVVPLLLQWQLVRMPCETDIEEEVSQRLQADLRVEGSLAAILSSQRNFLSEDMGEDHGIVARAGLPVLAIWGEEDGVIPIEARDDLAALNPAARQVALAGADHRLPYTHADRIAEAIERSL